MKIAQYIDRFYPTLGGGETHVAEIVRNIPQYKFDILTDSVAGFTSQEQYLPNTTIFRFSPSDNILKVSGRGMLSKILFPYRVLATWMRLKRKYNYLKNADFDVLHVHGVGISNDLLRLDGKIGRLFLTKSIDFSFVKKPKILTVHALPSNFGNDLLSRKYELRLIDMFDDIICVDKHLSTQIRAYVEEKNTDKEIYFIPNSVDTAKFSYSPLPEGDKLKVLFIGRLSNERGLSLICDLIKNLPEYVEFHMIASVAAMSLDKFKSLVDTSKIGVSTNVDNNLIPEYISKADVVLNPVEVEGISRVSLEAMSCGRPPIMLDIGDRYPVIDGKTGYLINNRITELLDLLEKLYNNKDKLDEVSKNAGKIVSAEFDSKTVVSRIKSIYQSLI